MLEVWSLDFFGDVLEVEVEVGGLGTSLVDCPVWETFELTFDIELELVGSRVAFGVDGAT